VGVQQPGKRLAPLGQLHKVPFQRLGEGIEEGSRRSVFGNQDAIFWIVESTGWNMLKHPLHGHFHDNLKQGNESARLLLFARNSEPQDFRMGPRHLAVCLAWPSD